MAKLTDEDLANLKRAMQKYWAEHPEEAAKQREKQRMREQGIPFCPQCGSTAITTGARGINATLGLIGASKTVNRCGNCGYTWKPSK